MCACVRACLMGIGVSVRVWDSYGCSSVRNFLILLDDAEIRSLGNWFRKFFELRIKISG